MAASIHIVADSLPEAWEKSVQACWELGDEFRTQFDGPDDPPSKDVAALIHVKKPFAEPRIHRAFPGGLDDLEKYRAEVCYGCHDYWMDVADPEGTKWEYTYHDRMRRYAMPKQYADGVLSTGIDQLAKVIAQLKACGHTRRAQAVTWKVWEDQDGKDPACLQRLWFRVQNGKLNMHCHIRSNDAYKAAFMNMHAFTELQAIIAEQVGVPPGEYLHFADSFHIYGNYFSEFEGFLKTVEKRSWEDRIYASTDEVVREFAILGCETLLREQGMPDRPRLSIESRKVALETALAEGD
jgi:thymidylate synthase